MKFLIHNDLHSRPLMRLLLAGLQVFVLLFLLFDVVYKSEQIGFSYEDVTTYLFGSEALFIDAVVLKALLEMLHADTFFIMMVLLTLGSVYARICSSKRRALYAVHTVMIAAFVAIISLLAARYISEYFIGLWMVGFWLWHLGAAGMSLEILWQLRR